MPIGVGSRDGKRRGGCGGGQRSTIGPKPGCIGICERKGNTARGSGAIVKGDKEEGIQRPFSVRHHHRVILIAPRRRRAGVADHLAVRVIFSIFFRILVRVEAAHKAHIGNSRATGIGDLEIGQEGLIVRTEGIGDLKLNAVGGGTCDDRLQKAPGGSISHRGRRAPGAAFVPVAIGHTVLIGRASDLIGEDIAFLGRTGHEEVTCGRRGPHIPAIAVHDHTELARSVEAGHRARGACTE